MVSERRLSHSMAERNRVTKRLVKRKNLNGLAHRGREHHGYLWESDQRAAAGHEVTASGVKLAYDGLPYGGAVAACAVW